MRLFTSHTTTNNNRIPNGHNKLILNQFCGLNDILNLKKNETTSRPICKFICPDGSKRSYINTFYSGNL